MNLPDKKFKIGDIVNIKSVNISEGWYIYGNHTVIGHTLLFNYGDTYTEKDYREIDCEDLDKLKDTPFTPHRWLIKFCHNNKYETYAEGHFELNIEETRNKKIKELLNI